MFFILTDGADAIGWSVTHRLIVIGGITCEIGAMTGRANGNPPPSYEWFDTKENVSISDDATLDLAEINRNYTFVASNTIRNEVLRYSRSLVVMNYTITQDCSKIISLIAAFCDLFIIIIVVDFSMSDQHCFQSARKMKFSNQANHNEDYI